MLIGWSILLIIHGILAVFLLGAITHQAVGVAWPVAKRSPGFFSAVRSVNGMSYTNAVIILFVVTAILGTIIGAGRPARFVNALPMSSSRWRPCGPRRPTS